MTRLIPFFAVAATVAFFALGVGVASAATQGRGPTSAPSSPGKEGGTIYFHSVDCPTQATQNGLAGPAFQAFVTRCQQGAI